MAEIKNETKFPKESYIRNEHVFCVMSFMNLSFECFRFEKKTSNIFIHRAVKKNKFQKKADHHNVLNEI